MSTENPVISNFVGLELLEKLLDACHLKVRPESHEELTLPDSNGGRATYLASSEFGGLRLTLSCDWTADDISAACASARIEANQIHLVAIVEDSALEKRVIIESIPLEARVNEMQIVGSENPRGESLLNNHSGCTVEIALVLVEQLPLLRRRPHRKGTTLAKRVFGIRVEANLGGLSPLPLTQEILSKYNLPPKTTSFVEVIETLLELVELGEDVKIYLNESLLESLKVIKGKTSRTLQLLAALDIQKQIVFMAAAELKGLDEEQRSATIDKAVMRMIIGWIKEVNRFDRTSFIDELIKSPEVVCAWISSRSDIAARTARLLSSDEGLEGGD